MTSYRITLDVEVTDEDAVMAAARALDGGLFEPPRILEDAVLWVIDDDSRLSEAGLEIIDTKIMMLDPPIKGHEVEPV